PGVCDHDPPRGPPRPLRRGGRRRCRDHGRARRRRPDRPGHDLRSADLRPPARARRGLPAAGPRRGRHVRLRRRALRAVRPGLLHRPDARGRPRQLVPGRPRGDLRARARRPAPRRRRRRGPDRERLALRAVRVGVLRRPRAGVAGRTCRADRDDERQRRDLVRRGRALRRLQAVGHRPGDGRRRVRGVPRDQGRRGRDLRMGEATGRFAGKVSIVTGAAGGIGEGYARALAAEGASVVVADIDLEGAEKVAASIRADGGSALGVRVDVSDPGSTREMAAAAVEAFGGIDHLVNNAAIFGGMEIDLLLTVDWEYYRRFMSVNLDGALLCTRACWEHMAARGGGAIVNQSSTAAWMYSNYYGLAKSGINGLTIQLAHEL